MSLQLKSSDEFEKAYSLLNERQLDAVNMLEGPMMVIAGPGTGKTQILAIRIGNILLNTDADPRNILCLTYTESGAIAMRQRLIKFIGPTAYEVNISTFHAFCNTIIRDNPEVFEQYSDFEVVSELEKNQLLLSILQDLDRSNVLYKYQGRYTSEIIKLSKFFENIKKENWDPQYLLEQIESHLEDMKCSNEMIYKVKRGENRAGDFNEKKYKDYCKPFSRTRAALELYQKYQDGLDKLERYEYEDMIQWVIKKFESDEVLLAKYQEKFQYILVDEYQDTNGAQNQILFHLLSFFESSNIFAVGDDDQAIYRFQGANVQNMVDFDLQYKPYKIVLINNYRSSQLILDTADAVIGHNKERLVNKDASLTKKLIATDDNNTSAIRPIFTEYEHSEAEVLDVCIQVEKLLRQGVAAKEIAILFRKNKEAEEFIKLFENKNIPYQTSRHLNVLDELLIQHLINILNYIVKETDESFGQDDILYKILHAPFIDIDAADISRMAWHLQMKRNQVENKINIPIECSLRNLLANETELKLAGVNHISACIDIHTKLNNAFKEIFDHTPQGMFEKILIEFNILNYIINHPDKIQFLQLLNSFFEFLKNETRKNGQMNLKDFTELIEEYSKNQIVIPNFQFIGSSKGVNLLTIHGSKGLEFEYVFMINNSHRQWSGRNIPSYKLPNAYVNEEINSEEDNRRLFYVGLTRAKKGIYVSYHRGNEKKPHTLSKFISEMFSSGLIDERKYLSSEDELIEQLLIELSPMKKNYHQMEDNLFDKFLERFHLNPTALTKYLECPLSFYYEKVLQIPAARTAPLGFGNAVHKALEKYIANRPAFKDGKFELVNKYFEKAMESFRSHFTSNEFKNYLEEGKDILPAFLKFHHEEWTNALNNESEIKITTELQSVPLSGKLDRIDHTRDGIRVVDYKTGKPDPKGKVIAPNENNIHGSDYWIQMVFYAILLKHQKSTSALRFVTSTFYFVNQTADKTFVKSEVAPSPEDISLVEELIVSTYEKIKAKQFTPGCGKPTCNWCSYVNSGVKITLNEESEEEEELD